MSSSFLSGKGKMWLIPSTFPLCAERTVLKLRSPLSCIEGSFIMIPVSYWIQLFTCSLSESQMKNTAYWHCQLLIGSRCLDTIIRQLIHVPCFSLGFLWLCSVNFFFVLLLDCADALPQEIVACLACLEFIWCSLLCFVSFSVHKGINWLFLLLQLLIINTSGIHRQT